MGVKKGEIFSLRESMHEVVHVHVTTYEDRHETVHCPNCEITCEYDRKMMPEGACVHIQKVLLDRMYVFGRRSATPS